MYGTVDWEIFWMAANFLILSGNSRAYRKAGYLTMVIAGYIPANSQLAAAIATHGKRLKYGKTRWIGDKDDTSKP